MSPSPNHIRWTVSSLLVNNLIISLFNNHKISILKSDNSATLEFNDLLIEKLNRSGLGSAPGNGKVFYNFGNFLRDQVIISLLP